MLFRSDFQRIGHPLAWILASAMFGRFPGEEQGEAVKDVLRSKNPSKRMADLLEIAKLAVYLASDDSAYVVGADFLIDGGVTAISAVGESNSPLPCLASTVACPASRPPYWRP